MTTNPFWNNLKINWEPLEYGIYRGFNSHHDLVIFHIPDHGRRIIETWSDAVIETVNHWPKDKAFSAIYDFSSASPYAMMTPVIRQCGHKMGTAHPNNWGRYALVIPASIVVKFAQRFINKEMKRLQPHLEGQVFFDDHASACTWVLEAKDCPAPTPSR